MPDTIVARGVSRKPKPSESPASPSYKPDRLVRALGIIKAGGVVRVGPGQFRVTGNEEPEYGVDLSQDPACTCQDMFYRHNDNQHPCKHILTARLMNGDTDLLVRIGEILEAEQSR